MTRSWIWASCFVFASAGALGCATGVDPDVYSEIGDDGGGGNVDAAASEQADAASAPVAHDGGGRGPDATAAEAGSDAVAEAAGGDASSSHDAGPDTSAGEAGVDARGEDASPDAEGSDSGGDSATDDDGESDDGGSSESGAVCNANTCSGCCDTSDVCHTHASPQYCPTNNGDLFQPGAPCEDCKAEGYEYCVDDIFEYVCSNHH